MVPHLLALSGPAAGRRFDLGADALTIGRHPTNALTLPDATLSRRHCAIERDGGRLRIRDLGSRHGTVVNDVPVTERVLADGDMLAIGSSLFLLVGAETATAAARDTVDVDSSRTLPATATRLPSGASVYLDTPRRMIARLGLEDMASRSLAALFALSRAAAEAEDSDGLANAILESVEEAVPADRAAFLVLEGDGAFRSAASTGSAIAISEALVDAVLAERSTVIADGSEPDGSAAVLCAPLTAGQDIVGLLQLERVTGPFADTDLEWVAAAAAIAGVAHRGIARRERLRDENRRLTERGLPGHGLVGDSEPIGKVRAFIDRAASTDVTVLVLGESGTGKELVAQALHRGSQRADEPFIAINCATLTDELLSSELFGHERGAFTGAVDRKVGKLERAHRGTLFLDEVGELSPILQAKLLRVLEERRFERLGGTRPIDVDVRLVAATNRDLEKAIADGSLREDLYYRLNVVSITLPPLRQRRADIPLLAQYFLRRHAGRMARRFDGLSAEARRCLLAYDWPGNVRELSNAVERAVVLGQSGLLQPEDLPESVLEAAPAGATGGDGSSASVRFHDVLNDTKRRLIKDAVATTEGNITRAAERLDLHPNHLHRLIKNLGIRDQL